MLSKTARTQAEKLGGTSLNMVPLVSENQRDLEKNLLIS
jgi:hypothetical protein